LSLLVRGRSLERTLPPRLVLVVTALAALLGLLAMTVDHDSPASRVESKGFVVRARPALSCATHTQW
jgi:hypothetical protein